MELYCYFNGEIVPETEAKVSVGDIGLLRGYGAYEGITASNGKIFRLMDHYERLVKSAEFLGLKVPVSEAQLGEIITQLFTKHDFERANFRVIITGGQTQSGIEASYEKPTFYILTEKHVPLSPETYQTGTKVITYEHQRLFPEYKTIGYVAAVRLQGERKAKGAIEIIYVNNDEVLEASTSNLFIVKNDKLITPRSGILYGITRKVILELANELGLEAEERPVIIQELFEADEVLISSSYKDIVPIVKIDDSVVANGQVGPKTKVLMGAFAKLVN